jgi:hypothetical protein
MNQFQTALTSVLEQNSENLELVSKGVNKLRAIYRGVVYENYSDLPKTARFAIARCIQSYSSIYTELREKYGVLEAEERLCWCLFGSFDGSADINVTLGKSKREISSHCTKCQYSKPFCKQVLDGLTPRQQECIMLMRTGLTDKEVALKMGISYLTVIKHIDNAVHRFRDMTDKPITRQYIVSQLTLAGL